jgi:outer membrane protein TolC
MKHRLSILLMFSALLGHTQEVLKLDEALQQALQNNHQIKALKYGQEIAENNVSWGNAGLLPSLALSGSYGGNVQNTDLEFAGNIPPVNVEGAQSATLNANASLSYVLFDGLSGRRTYERLGINKLAVDE